MKGKNSKFKSFEETRDFARSLGIKTQKDWYKYWNLQKRPDDIPYDPAQTYKKEGWKGWKDFLKREFISFEEAREFARSLGISMKKDWKKYCKSEKKPKNIPNYPDVHYKNKGWIDWNDFLGTGEKYKSLDEIKEFVRELGINKYHDWKKYCDSEKNLMIFQLHYKVSLSIKVGQIGMISLAKKIEYLDPLKKLEILQGDLNLIQLRNGMNIAHQEINLMISHAI